MRLRAFFFTVFSIALLPLVSQADYILSAPTSLSIAVGGSTTFSVLISSNSGDPLNAYATEFRISPTQGSPSVGSPTFALLQPDSYIDTTTSSAENYVFNANLDNNSAAGNTPPPPNIGGGRTASRIATFNSSYPHTSLIVNDVTNNNANELLTHGNQLLLQLTVIVPSTAQVGGQYMINLVSTNTYFDYSDSNGLPVEPNYQFTPISISVTDNGAVPEPSSVVLVGIGIVAMGSWRRFGCRAVLRRDTA